LTTSKLSDRAPSGRTATQGRLHLLEVARQRLDDVLGLVGPDGRRNGVVVDLDEPAVFERLRDAVDVALRHPASSAMVLAFASPVPVS